MTETKEMRFEFGKNWHRFIRKNFTKERCETARMHLQKFIERESLADLDFLDIGCGSGLHSLGAFQSGAVRVHSFDYDPNSVAATQLVRKSVGDPANWTVERGDALDQAYIAKLGKWQFVYSWGVLHHTGDVWQAIRNAQSTVADGGMFYLALYSADVDTEEGQRFWLDAKQDYNKSGWLGRKRWEWWYIWNNYMNRSIWKFPAFLRRVAEHRFGRGMNLFADLRDWLGGWPMQYTHDQDVVDLLEQECGFKLVNASTGEACSEFLFVRSGKPAQRTIVTDLVAEKRAPLPPPPPRPDTPMQRLVLERPFTAQGGHLYSAVVPALAPFGDDNDRPAQSPILLEEDGNIIGQPHSGHADISKLGRGRYSHWHENIYFSATDNSDPNTNGRQYSLLYPS
jgi:2-polyprenyl-6-hydroxyphenyl methylase/3-demethylubiquinone-9 3-methyltransferase